MIIFYQLQITIILFCFIYSSFYETNIRPFQSLKITLYLYHNFAQLLMFYVIINYFLAYYLNFDILSVQNFQSSVN